MTHFNRKCFHSDTSVDMASNTVNQPSKRRTLAELNFLVCSIVSQGFSVRFRYYSPSSYRQSSFIIKIELAIIIIHHGPPAIAFEPIMRLTGKYHSFTFCIICPDSTRKSLFKGMKQFGALGQNVVYLFTCILSIDSNGTSQLQSTASLGSYGSLNKYG